MIGKILLGAAAFAGGASLSPETKGKAKAAAREARDTARSAWKDLGEATKGARTRASTEWGRFTKWFREDVLEEPPRRDPPSSSPPS